MRQVLIGIGALAAIVAADVQRVDAASRPPRPYCLDAERTHLKDCSFYTFQQCLITAHGLGGICYENPEILWRLREGGAQPTPRKAKKRSQ